MTYILGSRCKDGVVMIADRKIVFDNFNTEYRDKLFLYLNQLVMGSSGSVSLFDKFRNYASTAAERLITYSEDQSSAVDEYISEIENRTGKLNERYAHKQPEFDVLIGIQTVTGAVLQHVYQRVSRRLFRNTGLSATVNRMVR
jgi:hypothetical protein